VFGSSGGGPHALACGALLAERVTRVAVVSGFAPAEDPGFDFFAAMSDLNIGELKAAANGEPELARLLTEFAQAAGANPDAMIDEIISELSDADQSALARPEVRAIFRDAIGASVRDGLSGWIDDDLAFMKPWGFDLNQITQPTLLMQGEFDLLVPRGHMAHIASRIRGSELQIISGAGHTLFDETRDIVAWAITDYSDRRPLSRPLASDAPA
jgi:pimeloyl-ACP methyl ester carboxylesterase